MTVESADSGSSDAAHYDELTRAAALGIDGDADLAAMDFGLTIVRAGNRLQQDLEQQVHRPGRVPRTVHHPLGGENLPDEARPPVEHIGGEHLERDQDSRQLRDDHAHGR